MCNNQYGTIQVCIGWIWGAAFAENTDNNEYCEICMVVFMYSTFAALGLPGWMGLDKSAAIAIVLGCILLTTALATAYKLYHCRRNRDLRNDEMRTANTGQYHGRCIHCV